MSAGGNIATFRTEGKICPKKIQKTKFFHSNIFLKSKARRRGYGHCGVNKSNRRNYKHLVVYEDLLNNKSKPSIYYFTVAKKDASYLYEILKQSKRTSSETRIKKGLAEKGYRSISHVPKSFIESNCIYVGSRKEKLHERFRQHLGFGSGRTGALHLLSVFEEEKCMPAIEFHYHILDEKFKNVTEHIECVVQNQLKPFIGKNLLED